LEGHFDAPSFPLTGFEKQAPIPLEKLETGPSFVIDFSTNMNEIVKLHERDMDVGKISFDSLQLDKLSLE
jgi:kynurenine formamidase